MTDLIASLAQDHRDGRLFRLEVSEILPCYPSRHPLFIILHFAFLILAFSISCFEPECRMMPDVHSGATPASARFRWALTKSSAHRARIIQRKALMQLLQDSYQEFGESIGSA